MSGSGRGPRGRRGAAARGTGREQESPRPAKTAGSPGAPKRAKPGVAGDPIRRKKGTAGASARVKKGPRAPARVKKGGPGAPAQEKTGRAGTPRTKKGRPVALSASAGSGFVLAIDVGNTQTVVGVFDGERLRDRFRISSGVPRSGDELRALLGGMMERHEPGLRESGRAVISSVVPTLTDAYLEVVRHWVEPAPLLVHAHNISRFLKVDVPDPMSVGADRLANAVGVAARGRLPAIVVDLGTTTNFDVVLDGPRYVGGAIAPGVWTSSEDLFRRGARLAKVEIIHPERALGTTTAECLQSGVFYGAIGQIDEIVRRIRAELSIRPQVIATGGLAHLLAGESKTIQRVDEDLTLKGLRVLAAGLP